MPDKYRLEAIALEPVDQWLRVQEAAEELKIPRSRCYELIQAGELPAVRVGERSIRVHRRQLEEFLLQERQVARDEGRAAMP